MDLSLEEEAISSISVSLLFLFIPVFIVVIFYWVTPQLQWKHSERIN
jgi:hypothetical protein